MKNLIQKIVQTKDIITGILLLIIVGLIIVKIPPFIMDILLIISICISVLTFLLSIYIQKPFALFPKILLLTSLFRVALNISVQRLILLDGHKGAEGVGHVITTAGKLITGSNLIAGLILVMLIMLAGFIFNLITITKVSRVCAGFISIDARESDSTPISPEETKGSKNERETDYYGTLDGAWKCLKGEVLASVIIVIISMVGGISMGIYRHGMTLNDAAVVYVTLAIGNAFLVTISTFLMTISMRLLASRTVIEKKIS